MQRAKEEAAIHREERAFEQQRAREKRKPLYSALGKKPNTSRGKNVGAPAR